MTVHEERRRLVREAGDRITAIIADAPSVERLEEAKSHLRALCERRELFPADAFPLPEGEATDRTFLIYDNDAGAALYAITGIPGMKYRPHDHGGSWAIIAAVAGQELHSFYEADPDDPGKLVDKGDVVCEPGTAVSMMPDGIHSIEGIGNSPLLHLHFYGTRFEDQAERTEYDVEAGTTDSFRIEAFGFIEDCR